MIEAVSSTMAQSWPLGSQIAVKKNQKLIGKNPKMIFLRDWDQLQKQEWPTSVKNILIKTRAHDFHLKHIFIFGELLTPAQIK